MSLEKAPVPKFGSFKPKASAKDSASTSAKEAGGSSAQHDRNRSEHHRHQRENESREHDRRRRREGRDSDPYSKHVSRHRQQRSASPELARDEFEESDLFIVDRRGDSKNAEYGSLHRYSIPAYHRTGRGLVIGISSNLKLDRDATTEKEVVFWPVNDRNGQRAERLLTAKRGNAEPRSLRLVMPTTTADEHDLNRDFLELRPSLKRKRGSEDHDEHSAAADYRSIEGKAKPDTTPEDEDLVFASDLDIEPAESNLEIQVRQENAVLSKKAKESPTDANAWFALIEHQAKVVHPGTDSISLTTAEKRALADIRLSIYDRAMKHITKGKPDHERLLLGSIDQGSLIWEASKLALKWNAALKESPTSILLWTRYLDFVQTDHLVFRYEKCKAAYIHCFKILQCALASASEGDKIDINRAQVYVLVRFTAFVRDSGYDELAFATWQVLFEYHFFRPENLANREAELESLEAFWESDVPRIGEENASGWVQFVEGIRSSTRRSVRISMPPYDPDRPFASFVEQETRAMGTLQLPAVLDDDSAADDPFLHVMFSDLREVAECLLDHLPKSSLVNAFLAFMHLPALPDSTSESTKTAWQTDPYLATELIGQALQANLSTSSLLQEGARMQNIRSTTIYLLDNAFNTFHETLIGRGELGEAISRFVDRVLDKLVSAESSNDLLAEYYLAFKSQMFPLEVAKAAKRLLKARPSSLRLYNAYALTEVKLGRIDKAERVWSTASAMSQNFSVEARDDTILLWHSHLLTLLHQKDAAEALGCILSMADGSTSPHLDSPNLSAGQRLRIRQHLQGGFEQMMTKKEYGHAVLYAECFAWFAYLADDHSLEFAMQTFDKYSMKFSAEGLALALELLHQAKARIFKLHIEKRRPYKPGMLRDELEESIKLFPENSMFLETYAQVGAQTRIDDRLRDAVRNNTLNDSKSGLVRWSFSIAEEIRRCSTEISGSTQNSVRSLFMSTLLSPGSLVRHSQSLWTSWFLFEQLRGDDVLHSTTSFQRMKQVFFDGLRYLPWCKTWVIMGLRYFIRAGMAENDLRKIYDVLSERELRVRVDIEDT